MFKNIDKLGRVVIPSDIRKYLGIKTGDLLTIKLQDNKIILEKEEKK